MIEGGELTPDANLEVDWSNFEKTAIKSEEDLYKILKEFLWHRCDRDAETHAMLDLKILDNDGKEFEEIYKESEYPLISSPTDEHPFQLIHEHVLEDAFYEFNYIDGTLPLNIEYQKYDNQKFLLGITQKGEECECNPQGDGGTHDQHITFRFLDSKGEICSIRSSNFSHLPLEIIEDNEDEYREAIKNIAKNFYKELSY